jgi:hypothetical protein
MTDRAATAERQCRRRRRRKAHRRVFRVEADEIALAALLVRGGFLHPTCADIPEAIAAALETMLSRAVTRDAALSGNAP